MTRHLSPSGIGVRHADHCADWLRRRLRPGHGQIRRPLWYLAGAARSPPVADSGVGGADGRGFAHHGEPCHLDRGGGMVPKPALEPLRRWDPERIGPYAVLGRLGAGAMGRVYLGRSTAGRLVAVKTIKIELADEAGFRARFAHEVAAARRVSGVFTAAVVAADPEADMPWLATAYVPAPSLSKLVAECGPLPVPAARWLAAGCAEALESIHSAELDGIVTACLARSPRQRPTSAALLDQLGDFTAAAGPRSAHAYLPAPAMAVISGYQHGPWQAARAPADGGEDTSGGAGAGTSNGTGGNSGGGTGVGEATFGSHTALPVSVPARPGRQLPQHGADGSGRADGGAVISTQRLARRRRRRLALIVAAAAAVAAALVTCGIIVGTLLTDGGGTGAASGTVGLPPPTGPPPSAFPALPAGSPRIAVLQPMGDSATVFLIHGTGWVPRSRVTVTLDGYGHSPIRPVVDLKGTFNYAVNQGHEVSPRPLRPGAYHLLA